ncbi:uncharacterized protein LOC132396337 [Hypanus sabinus]|uniref:uncharacterized protein LOC132396337 n=1 Tax=Hypanus sabinus TaxID=79690 RepID=UPI0028C3987C|nr:uncharacterized protein LOC132396337 [Hypanus sabinus]
MRNLLNFWGSGEDPQDGEISSGTSAGLGSWLWQLIAGSSEKLQCNVQCYGRGDVHEKIVKELDISQCEKPGVPCVLFVYKVSCVIQDLQNVLQSVTGEGRARKEDICAVILLVSCRDVAEEMKRTDPESFPEGTEIMAVTNPGLLEDPQGDEIRTVPWTVLHSWFWYLWDRYIIDRSSEKLQCNVQCYGRGDVHEKSVKELNISSGEGPEIPCVLFVFKVSREIEDLRNSLQWVTEKQGLKRRNICAVILVDKCLHKWKMPVEVNHQGIFDTDTVVVRILWDSPEQIHEAMDKVKQSIRRWWGDNWTVIHTAETLDNLYKPVDVAYQTMLNPKTVVVRMLWDSPEKIQEQPCYKKAVDKVKQSIRMWWDYSKDTSAFTTL